MRHSLLFIFLSKFLSPTMGLCGMWRCMRLINLHNLHLITLMNAFNYDLPCIPASVSQPPYAICYMHYTSTAYTFEIIFSSERWFQKWIKAIKNQINNWNCLRYRHVVHCPHFYSDANYQIKRSEWRECISIISMTYYEYLRNNYRTQKSVSQRQVHITRLRFLWPESL